MRTPLIRRAVVVLQADAAFYAKLASLNVNYDDRAHPIFVRDCRAENRYWQRRSAECTAAIRAVMGIES